MTPYEPELDAIRWIEDPDHGPSRPKSWHCWVIFWRPCAHRSEHDVMRIPEKGGYAAGGRTVSELPPPPPSVTVERQPARMTMGEFRELTAGVPDEWPILLQVRHGDNDFTFAETDAAVDLTGRVVEIIDDTHVRRASP